MKFITVKELSELLNVSTTTIYRECEKGMPHIKVASQYRFQIEKVLHYLEKRNE